MDELLAALRAFLEKFRPIADPKEKEAALAAFHKEAQPVAQHFIDMGHGIERENSKQAIKDAADAKVEAERQLTEAKTTIDQLQKDKPDIAGMQKQHADEIERVKNENKKELTKREDRIRKILMERDLGALKSFLKDKKVDPEIAHNLTFENASLSDRIKHDDNGFPTVFQAGTQTPYSVAQGQTPLDPLGEELLKRVPKGAFTEEVDEGTEISGHRTEGGGKGGKTTKFDTIREEVAESEKNRGDTDIATRRAQKFGRAPAR